jgi:hypothetical protein
MYEYGFQHGTGKTVENSEGDFYQLDINFKRKSDSYYKDYDEKSTFACPSCQIVFIED